MNIAKEIKTELAKHNDVSYWGTKEEISNSNAIYDYVLSNKIVNQEWFDDRLKCTITELLKDILDEFTNTK